MPEFSDPKIGKAFEATLEQHAGAFEALARYDEESSEDDEIVLVMDDYVMMRSKDGRIHKVPIETRSDRNSDQR